jgi:3-phosphoshikimate 1-carboxyvinyltransferase
MSRSMRIKGPARVEGSISVPGDKSISHRIAMLASVAGGTSRVTGMASSADCRATLDCIQKLGIAVEESGPELVIHGHGLFGYRPLAQVVELDAGNSGSTIRMLSGLLAAQRFTSRIDGDASLRRRPMERIVEPLNLMGAQVEATDGNFPPLTIHGQDLKAINYASSVASAQVKTCVLLAGLLAEGHTNFSEPALSRNHTELMLEELGASIETVGDIAGRDACAPRTVSVEGRHELNPLDYRVPGDISSAAFFVAAATILPGSKLLIKNVNLNPTRTGFLDVLAQLGARIERPSVREQHRELVGDLVVSSHQLTAEGRGMILSGAIIPNILDEIPMLAVVATQVEGRIEVRDARELRIKESDRIRTVAQGIRALGGEIEEKEDGFSISGPQRLIGGRVNSAGDHRIAMAFSIAGLIADGTTEITEADCASVSFPEFYESLTMLTSPDGAVQTILD